jgi:hypothetical protein
VTGEAYTRYSRFTDPRALAPLLDALPPTPTELCEIAERQTIHHNLLGYYGLDRNEARALRRVWPPRLPDVLAALVEIEPGNLHDARTPQQRIVGACMLEAHFLAGLLRSKGIPTRIRAGYFQGIRAHGAHVVRFWRGALRARGVNDDLLEADPERWGETVDAVSTARNEADHHIEHWVCEYREEPTRTWRLLDANKSFLKAHSNLEVGFHLPAAHFEYAFQAWKRMRSTADFDPEQYVEEPQDGRSHIRSQLLCDFYSLLNHDLAGIDDSDETLAFVKQQTYEASSSEELAALDALAELVDTDPSIGRLRAFYFANRPLRIGSAEADPYSFVFTG